MKPIRWPPQSRSSSTRLRCMSVCFYSALWMCIADAANPKCFTTLCWSVRCVVSVRPSVRPPASPHSLNRGVTLTARRRIQRWSFQRGEEVVRRPGGGRVETKNRAFHHHTSALIRVFNFIIYTHIIKIPVCLQTQQYMFFFVFVLFLTCIVKMYCYNHFFLSQMKITKKISTWHKV